MTTSRTTDRRHERGVAIIWTAFFLLLLLGFVAIGVDVAKVMATRTSLQNAADAAALAGASAINAETGVMSPDTAVTRAQATSVLNKAFVNDPVPVSLAAGDVVVNTADRTVKVTVRRDAAGDGAMITHVAQVLGIKSLELSATATAKADYSDQVCEGLTPMGVLPSAVAFTGCGGVPAVLFRDEGVTGNYGGVSFAKCDEGPCAGMNSRGANTFGCLLSNGYSCCVAVGQTIDTQPGTMMGKLREGLEARWNADSDKRTGICHKQYQGTGERIVIVPIIDSIPHGRSQPVGVVGFAAFFLLTPPPYSPNMNIEGQFIHKVSPGGGGGAPSGVFSLRLIQ